MRFSRSVRFVFVALLALIGASVVAAPSHAQGTIRITVVKGGWFIGAQGGSGVLSLGGRNYRLSIGGLSAGLVFGGSSTEFYGEVYNIRRPGDINGVYTAIGAGVAAGGGARVIEMQNSRGVVLHLRGRQIGLMLNLDLSGMSISLR